MPELPEVEHVVRALRRAVLRRRILAVEVKMPRLVAAPSLATFKRKMSGTRIADISRRGKYILFQLDDGQVLLVHLRMTGKFLSIGIDDPLPPYPHVVFYLDDDRRLVFCDMRQFGRMRLLHAKALLDLPQIATLAPEPLSEVFSPEYFLKTLSKSQRSLKQLLLDQTRVLGLGNIYASEALFMAGVNPRKPASSLSKKRALTLYQSIRDVLKTAVDAGSTLRIDLNDRNGSYIGSSERFWKVYEREGEPCLNCRTRIRRIVQGGRSTYFCPRCQRR